MSAKDKGKEGGQNILDKMKNANYTGKLAIHIFHIIGGLLLLTYVGFNKKPHWLAKLLVGLLGLFAGVYHFILIGHMKHGKKQKPWW